jgi:hypothetical protein
MTSHRLDAYLPHVCFLLLSPPALHSITKDIAPRSILHLFRFQATRSGSGFSLLLYVFALV